MISLTTRQKQKTYPNLNLATACDEERTRRKSSGQRNQKSCRTKKCFIILICDVIGTSDVIVIDRLQGGEQGRAEGQDVLRVVHGHGRDD